jgi:hypothetical protein
VHGAAEPVGTLPPVPSGVVNAARYPTVAALGPGSSGGGDTGGGDTGGGDTGGGDTGGGDTGGGDTAGGDTGGPIVSLLPPTGPRTTSLRGPRSGFAPPGTGGRGFLPPPGGQAANGGAAFLFTPDPTDEDEDADE